MKYNLPSVKTLQRLTDTGCRIDAREGAKLLRQVLECDSTPKLWELVDNCDAFNGYIRPYSYSPRPLQYLKLNVASFLTHGHGVEYIARGHNSKSPSIEYVNQGDSYALTLMWIRGRYVVGCWGDIVERGSYD